jgi:toxin ParE1/3/4
MTAEEHPWSVRLSATAEVDFQNIIEWTLEKFGDMQALVYSDTLLAALNSLTAGPTAPGVRARREIGKGLFTLHVARGGRKGRHFVLFRVDEGREGRVVDVLRVLHDAMDLSRHVPRGPSE